MNKKLIGLLSLIILCILGLIGYYFRDTIVSQYKENISNTSSGKTVNELISKNYNKEFHHLDLKTKKLQEIPNICDMVSGTNYEYDIWSLDLSDNNIKEINKSLSCLKNLSELNLSFNKIKEINNLESLTFIKKLDLGNNLLTKIEGLEKLNTLNDLHLGYNQITSTKGLEKLTNLTSLKLQHNEIDDLSGIKDLLTLEELKMEFNKLTNEELKNIVGLKSLKIITVGENAGIKKETIDKLNEFSLKNMQDKQK